MPRLIHLLGVWLRGAAVLLLGVSTLPAQVVVTQNAPRPAESVPTVLSIVPPGATIGRETEWTVTGRNLAGVQGFRIAGGGVEVAAIKKKTTGSIVVVVRASADAAPGFREVHAESPDGLSNLMVVRVDSLDQTAETEPNDDPAQANELPRGSAGYGVLKPQDLDHFRIAGKSGERLTFEIEAQRLGSPLAPIVTVLTPSGVALAQGRPARGDERDCRLTYTLPADGTYVIQARDNTYGGGDSAVYRLRVTNAPFASGLFPLGGPRGQSLTVTASGGNLAEPRSKTLTLPDQPGSTVEVGPIEGPGGPVLVTSRLAVGDGPEVFEAADEQGASPTRLAIDRREGRLGTIAANGRLDRAGEVDRYVLAVRKGDQVRVKVQAASLGSWLDSVVALRDAAGSALAENDDPGGNGNNNRGGAFGAGDTSPDSLLDYEARADGDLFLEITDRFGDGGPEYAYRLLVGAPRPDFEIKLLLGNPNANPRFQATGRRVAAGGPAASGVLNLKPGASLPINFLVTPTGRPGPIVVKAEGLPPGVTSDPVTVRLPASGAGNRGNSPPNAPPASSSLVLRVAANAAPAVGELRVVATAKREDGTILTREAAGLVVLDPAPANNSQVPAPVRVVSRIPVKIVGTPRPVEPARPDRPLEAVALQQISVPGLLLQGGRLDLAVELEPADARPDRYTLNAEARDRGLTIADAGAAASEALENGVSLRVLAAVDAAPGVKTVRVRFQPKPGAASARDVLVIVRPPIRVWARPEPIALPPGGSGSFWVGVEREPGYSGPVELRVLGLPAGVKVLGRTIVPAEENGGMVRLAREKRAAPPARPVAVRVVGVARMPKGPVSVESAIRPMLADSRADK